jgi:hypothetical protein
MASACSRVPIWHPVLLFGKQSRFLNAGSHSFPQAGSRLMDGYVDIGIIFNPSEFKIQTQLTTLTLILALYTSSIASSFFLYNRSSITSLIFSKVIEIRDSYALAQQALDIVLRRRRSSRSCSRICGWLGQQSRRKQSSN